MIIGLVGFGENTINYDCSILNKTNVHTLQKMNPSEGMTIDATVNDWVASVDPNHFSLGHTFNDLGFIGAKGLF